MKTGAEPGRKRLTACKFSEFILRAEHATRCQYPTSTRALQESLLYPHLRDSEDQDAHRGLLTCINAQDNAQKGAYMRIYRALEDQLSFFKINEAVSETRSSDSARLREKLPMYILQNPKVDVMKPVINSSTSRSELGLNHVQLAGYLCPVEFVGAFNENAEEYVLFFYS